MILFTQSTAVLYKYLTDEPKLLCYNSSRRLHIIPWVVRVQRNPWVFQVFQVCGHPVLSACCWRQKTKRKTDAEREREREIEREKGTKTVRVNGVSIISSSTQLLLDCVDGRQRPLASALSAYLRRCQQKINIECDSAASRDHDVIETGLQCSWLPQNTRLAVQQLLFYATHIIVNTPAL